ncbi:MAG: ABC transporter ATP-binding protein [Candidatus Thorarchaeota archaeon]
MSEVIVSVSNIVKDFTEVRALDKVSLDIESGIFGFIGPNGAGKTTFLRVLLGLSRPDSGSGEVLGHDILKESMAIRGRIGVLHEKPFFPKTMTPLEYLTKVSRLYGKDTHSEELLEKVGLSEAANRRIGKFSAGMHQRLGIAQALAGDPELVFLDEPTSNLDVTGRQDLIQLIVNLHHEQGTSFFISSHILSELEKACHNVAFLKRGYVVKKGRVLDIVKEHTQTAFRVVTSDPQELYRAMEGFSAIIRIEITGVNTITLRGAVEDQSALRSEVTRVANQYGIEVYAFEEISTLEEAYKDIMDEGTHSALESSS